MYCVSKLSRQLAQPKNTSHYPQVILAHGPEIAVLLVCAGGPLCTPRVEKSCLMFMAQASCLGKELASLPQTLWPAALSTAWPDPPQQKGNKALSEGDIQ